MNLFDLMAQLHASSMEVAYMRSWNPYSAMSNEDMVLVWSWHYIRRVNPPLCLVEGTRKHVTLAALSCMRSVPLFSLNINGDLRNLDTIRYIL